MKEEHKQKVMASSLGRMGSALLKTVHVAVEWLFKDELGYTSKGTSTHCTVHVAWSNEDYIDMLSESKKDAFRMGVFAHELLHQLLTNFDYMKEVGDKMNRAEASVFMEFFNIIEDPSIEYFAPTCFGGKLLDSLRYSIKRIYKVSPGIEKSPNAFTQLMNALINFGDMGIVKGKWTYPEAKEMFKKIAPVFNEAVICPDSKKRVDYAVECMEIARPLWEEEIKNSDLLQKLFDALDEMLKKSGKPLKEPDAESNMGGPSTRISKRRNKTAKKLSESNDDESKKSFEKEDDDPVDEATKDEDEANEEADDSFEIDDEFLDKIKQSLDEEDKRISKIDKENKAEPFDIPDMDIKGKFKGKVRCKNIKVSDHICNKDRVHEMYLLEKGRCTKDIKLLTKSLNKIFSADKEEFFASTTGEYNIIRGSLNTSARVFDKRKDPAKLNDVAVMLLVDLSGSMRGGKESQARKTAITMAEALTALKIPNYIMGFHADKGSFDAIHDHFVTWNNSKAERESLVTMQAHDNNFDGYSIRYAASLLSKRPESNKLLFVISDGQPAADKYRSYEEGIVDTTDAIKQSRKNNMTVFGIAIGAFYGYEILQKMYGKDFIYVENENLLTNMLCKKLSKCIAKK